MTKRAYNPDEHLVDILEPPKYLPSGKTQGIVQAIRNGDWLHTTDVWLYRTQPELQILFQQRDPKSPTYPGLLDCSTAGYLEAGETGVQGGIREVREELGIKLDAKNVVPFGRRLNAMLDHRGRERRIVANIHIVQWNHELSDLAINQKEVHGVFWVSVEALLDIERGDAAQIIGMSPSGEEITRKVAKTDFAYNLDDYYFRLAERIKRFGGEL